MKQFVLAMVMGLAAVPGWADDARRQITVTGQGAVQMAPDMAVISLGVTHQDKDAARAMARASEGAAAVLKRLEAQGVEGRDMQTSSVNLSPVYSSRSSNVPQVVEGFRAGLMMTVRVRDLDALGGILGAVVQDGANRFSGLHFALSDPQTAEDAARAKAVKDALRKAALYAQAADVELGQVVSINENGGGGYPQMRMAEAARMSDVPIAEGELNISQSVTLVIALD